MALLLGICIGFLFAVSWPIALVVLFLAILLINY